MLIERPTKTVFISSNSSNNNSNNFAKAIIVVIAVEIMLYLVKAYCVLSLCCMFTLD